MANQTVAGHKQAESLREDGSKANHRTLPNASFRTCTQCRKDGLKIKLKQREMVPGTESPIGLKILKK